MSKEMNKLLRETIKYDWGSGVLISLLIGLFSSFFDSMIYFLGIMVGMINFIGSVYAANRFLLKKSGDAIVLLITILRITFVILVAAPIIHNLKFVILYIAGFISHLIIFGISCLIKNK